MNAKIIQALREYEVEISALCYEYYCKDAMTTRDYSNRKDNAMRRCKMKIEIAVEDEDESKTENRNSQFLKDWSNI